MERSAKFRTQRARIVAAQVCREGALLLLALCKAPQNMAMLRMIQRTQKHMVRDENGQLV